MEVYMEAKVNVFMKNTRACVAMASVVVKKQK